MLEAVIALVLILIIVFLPVGILGYLLWGNSNG